ncbi:tRNA(Ile)-lysidine synthase [Candidatus Kinetoplastibacterium blastocrithidii TCC012E]|uniref:tRNA(Ile)-lysidine synthase n=1 Tax=Candidatus Kinetoplastidibacterium blastocrithidiae TCC012E TaxID=1208922 RepID=M1M359_9PROT|nr:tRNA lysidine(34) synthetase TilS [Candidatus Kinetoplastibacterium blastocrithidii]AFZ83512.1 tRNA(Ile)-lysidine synthase [Candidatus Kinetoplastibacterium blastocrithidii (ex Strigomonas culicis)]AGF49609.1 tRNA(Ile)-lysidine synthase [Candidatus Kinetoplastibacterium blastocrithidii TCC012E]
MYVVPEHLYNSLRSSLLSLEALPKRIAVGFSGGMDSAMLSIVATKVTYDLNISLFLFHINHCLQDDSDSWSKNACNLASLLNTPFHEKKIHVDRKSKHGLEASARDSRYKAFDSLLDFYEIKHLLLAHHKDDQAETVLLRLLRGSGIKGMGAMRHISIKNGKSYIRPWLNISKEMISSEMRLFSNLNSWHPINDPTNVDMSTARSIIRACLAPQLDKYWPRWRDSLCRNAYHMSSASDVLENLAKLDFDDIKTNSSSCFSLSKWRSINSTYRKIQVLRYWFLVNNLNMPTESFINNLYRQLSNLHALGYDRFMKLKYGAYIIVCRKGLVWVELSKLINY